MSRREGGFTLMEVLVVMLILGVLAAVALPTFLGQREKGHDGAAKSNARNLVSQIESCFVRTEDYRECANSQLDVTGLKLSGTDWATPAAGEVSVEQAPTANQFTVAARSLSGALFRISRGAAGYSRSCAPNGPLCKSGQW